MIYHIIKFHPDVNKDSDSSEKYINIQSAYNVLSKPDLRENYDMVVRKRFGQETQFSSSNNIPINNEKGMPFYDIQRINFKETQKYASSNWRDLKDKYKSEQWQKKPLAFKKVNVIKLI